MNSSARRKPKRPSTDLALRIERYGHAGKAWSWLILPVMAIVITLHSGAHVPTSVPGSTCPAGLDGVEASGSVN